MDFGYELTVGTRTSLNPLIQHNFRREKRFYGCTLHLILFVPLCVRKHSRQTAVEVVQGLLDHICSQKHGLIFFLYILGKRSWNRSMK